MNEIVEAKVIKTGSETKDAYLLVEKSFFVTIEKAYGSQTTICVGWDWKVFNSFEKARQLEIEGRIEELREFYADGDFQTIMKELRQNYLASLLALPDLLQNQIMIQMQKLTPTLYEDFIKEDLTSKCTHKHALLMEFKVLEPNNPFPEKTITLDEKGHGYLQDSFRLTGTPNLVYLAFGIGIAKPITNLPTIADFAQQMPAEFEEVIKKNITRHKQFQDNLISLRIRNF